MRLNSATTILAIIVIVLMITICVMSAVYLDRFNKSKTFTMPRNAQIALTSLGAVGGSLGAVFGFVAIASNNA